MAANPNSPNDLFIDSVGNIGIQAAIGRIELLRLAKVPVGNEAAEYFVDGRLVMSLDTLLRLYQGLSEVVHQLEDKGLVKRPDTEKAAPEKPAAAKASKK
jgi:hypothetical protein